MSMLYYVEKVIEETGKPPLQNFYESPTPEYKLAYPDPLSIVSTGGKVTYRPPEGFNWETASSEERREVYESNPKDFKYGGVVGATQSVVENITKIVETVKEVRENWEIIFAVGLGFIVLILLITAIK